MATESSGACPRCHKDDQVRKVTAVIQGGVTTGQQDAVVPGKLGDTTYYVQSKQGTASATLLAQRLIPPSDDEVLAETKRRWTEPLYAPWWHIVALVIIVVGALVGCVRALFGLPGGVFLLVFVVVFGLGFVLIAPRFAPTEFKERRAKWLSQLEHMKKQVAVEYHRLYYCGRDDVVFDPEDTQHSFVPIEQMRSFLYEQAAKDI